MCPEDAAFRGSPKLPDSVTDDFSLQQDKNTFLQQQGKEEFILTQFSTNDLEKKAADLITFLATRNTGRKKNKIHGTVCCAIAFNATDIILTINHDSIDYSETKFPEKGTPFYKNLIAIDNFQTETSDIVNDILEKFPVFKQFENLYMKMPDIPGDDNVPKVPCYFRDIDRIYRYFSDLDKQKTASSPYGSYVTNRCVSRFKYFGLYLEVIRAQIARFSIQEDSAFQDHAKVLLPMLPIFFRRGLLGYIYSQLSDTHENRAEIIDLIKKEDDKLTNFFSKNHPFGQTIDCLNSIVWLLKHREAVHVQLVISPEPLIVHCEIQLLLTLSLTEYKDKQFKIIVSKPFCGSCTVFFYGFVDSINKELETDDPKKIEIQKQLGVAASPALDFRVLFKRIVKAVNKENLREFLSYPWCLGVFPDHVFSIHPHRLIDSEVYLSCCVIVLIVSSRDLLFVRVGVQGKVTVQKPDSKGQVI